MTTAGLFVLSALATALGVALSRRWPFYRPVRNVLALGLAADAMTQGLVRAIAGAPRPLTGWARVLGHAESALFLAYPFAVAGLALLVLARRPWWLAAAAWALLVAVLVVTYPVSRGALLGHVYAGAEAACVVVGLGSAVAFARRERVWPLAHHTATLLLVAGEATLLVGPYATSPFRDWFAAQIAYAVTFAVLAVLEALWLRRSALT